MVNVLSLGSGETITAAVAVPLFDAQHFCVMATRNGRIKRIPLNEFASVRPSGLLAINLESKDILGWARLTDGEDEIILVTERGQALRYSEAEIRPMGRNAAGVTAIRLDRGDLVTSMEVVEDEASLLVLTRLGYGKRTPLSEYPPKGRATGGIKTIDTNAFEKIGTIASARVVQEADDLTIMSANGVVLRTNVKDISQSGRATRGVMLINLGSGDYVSTMARVADLDLKLAEGALEKPAPST